MSSSIAKPIPTKLALSIVLVCAISAGWYLLAFTNSVVKEIETLHNLDDESLMIQELL